MQRKRLVGLLCVALLGLAGCAATVSDADALREAVTPERWTAAPIRGSAQGYVAFWSRWNDPVLAALVGRAMEVNTDVLSARANLRAARASLTAANAALWPTAELSADADRRRAAHRTSTGYGADLRGAWTLNLAGSEFLSASAEDEAVRAQELTLADVREMVAAETAQAYVNLRAAEASLRVARSSLANYAQTADTARWQYEAGMGSAAQAEDAMTQLASSRARIPQLEASVEGYRNALARLTAQPVGHLSKGEVGAIPEPPEGCGAALPAELLSRRPDVRSARHALEGAVLRLRSAESDWFPSLGLTGSIGTDAATVGALGASGTGIVGLAAALTLPVLNWGSLMAAEERAAAELDRQRAQYVAVLLRALEETQNALTGIEGAERRSGDLSRALLHARTAARLAKLEYGSGMGDYTMVLSTERTLLSAEDAELSNRAERANNYIMLYRAMGGGWAAEADRNGTQTANGKDGDK